MDNKQLLDKMRVTKDKNLYYECYLDQFANFDFIVEVIKIFKDDFDFIDEVAERYVKYIPEENINANPQYIELCMLLGQYVPEGHQYYEFYTNRLNGIYSIFLLHVMMVKDELEGVSELGFSILMEDYGDRKNILDYFATRLMDELYHKNHCGSFEDLIHKHCDSPQNVQTEGYEQFFIRNLYGVDEKLSYYVFDNPHLLKNLIEELDEICENWYIYEDELSARCVDVIKEWVCKKSEEETYGNDFNYEQAMNEVLLSMNFCKMFGLNRREVYVNQSKILSFGSARFKKDLKEVINKVLMERLTLFELNNLNLDSDEGPKKVLQP
jgi:hypothetical protein